MKKTVFFCTFEEEDAELLYQWKNDDDLKKLSTGMNRYVSREEVLDLASDTILIRCIGLFVPRILAR